MLAYWLLFLLPVMAAVSPVRLNARSQVMVWALVGLVFTFVVGLRHEVGGDWATYLHHFEWRAHLSLDVALSMGDPGYYFINWLVAQVPGSIYHVNLICAAVLVIGVTSFCRAQPQPWVALAVAVPYLIIVVGMGYTRQATALGFVLLGLTALGRGSALRFAGWVLMGALFHKSAVLMLPVAALASTGSRFWSLIWVGVVSLCGAYFFVFDAADQLWQSYVEANYQSEGGLIRVLMNAVPAVFFMMFHRRLELNLSERRLWWWMSLFALACIPLVVISSTATDRVALYLIPLQLFVFSRLHQLARSQKIQSLIVLGVLFYYATVLAVWLLFAAHAFAWLPYQMSWFVAEPML